MKSEALKQLIQERPFLPLEVYLSSGRKHIILQPECAAIGRETLVIIDPETDVVNHCSLIHITNVVRQQQSAA